MGKKGGWEMNKTTADGIRIAAYMRLSKTDEAVSGEREKLAKESNSISMQRMLICKYIESHFQVYQIVEYIDV